MGMGDTLSGGDWGCTTRFIISVDWIGLDGTYRKESGKGRRALRFERIGLSNWDERIESMNKSPRRHGAGRDHLGEGGKEML